MKKISRYLFSISLFLIMLLSLSCSNLANKMMEAYNQGQYVEASEIAVEGIKDPGLRPEIEAFIVSNGEQLLVSMLLKGEYLSKDNPNKETVIIYYDSLIQVLEEMLILNFDITGIRKTIKEAEDRQLEAIASFVKKQYELGLKTFKNKLYRASFTHFKNVNKYYSNYKKTAEYLRQAFKYSERYVSIAPFYKKADFVSRVISDTLTKILSGADSSGTLKADVKIEGVNVPDKFTKTLYNKFSSKKSLYLHFSINDPEDNIDHTQYYIDGELDIRVEDNRSNPDRSRVTDVLEYSLPAQNGYVWRDHYFEYDLFTIRYKFKVYIKAGLYLTANDQKIYDILAEGVSESVSEYRGMPYNLPISSNNIQKGARYAHNANQALDMQNIRYPNTYLAKATNPIPVSRASIVKDAIEKAADDVVRDVLLIIDKDMDPYLIKKIRDI
jgi:hypothetical protein